MAPYSVDMVFPTAILAMNSLGLGLSFMAVVVRLCARHARNIRWRLADYTIIVSWIFTFGLVVSENYIVVKGGVGQQLEMVDMEELLFAQKQFLVLGVCGSLAVTFVKISLLDFFLSIFSIRKSFRLAAYTLMAMTIGYGISFTIATLASCQPFEANWDKLNNPGYKCINTSVFYVAQGAIGAALDISILLMPIPIVWSMKAKTQRKIGLTFLFTIGISICVISLFRLYYNTRSTWMVTHFTEYAGIAAILGALEANLSIICACLPAFPSLLKPLIEKLRSNLSSNKSGSFLGLFYKFSSRRTRGPTTGSIKLTSSAEALGPGHSSAPTDPENGYNRPKNVDYTSRLYPLSETSASRGSIEGAMFWPKAGQVGVQTITTAESVELERLGGRMETWGNVRP
ncbi:hypothetical protein KVR01_006005 [Diaporthe batatas]|uniref:uncharacterized protein n=1 Tax=Diaporthe batatas TaxID=748121 RepID=UPI001D05B7F4|nr:uncharacterized protein KVR01_006005 [Diaporthe batatas]KAG8164087.1 hypothetical protein KVR01_006005 [Diaporthe batatas]